MSDWQERITRETAPAIRAERGPGQAGAAAAQPEPGAAVPAEPEPSSAEHDREDGA